MQHHQRRPGAPHARPELCDRILALLRGLPEGLPRGEIARRLGRRANTYFRQVLAGMVEAGELVRQGVAYRPAVPATEATFGPGELGAEPPR